MVAAAACTVVLKGTSAEVVAAEIALFIARVEEYAVRIKLNCAPVKYGSRAVAISDVV